MYIPISALQHYVFCPRQCALIHNEGLWAENFLTAQANLLHRRVDSGEMETRKGIRYERAVLVSSERLQLVGKLDLLEIHIDTNEWIPVEYKRGKSKSNNCDRVQLCAQALCLEEMKNIHIQKGAIWYAQTHHREEVILTSELRQETELVITSVKEMLVTGDLPKPSYRQSCKACSLSSQCLPKTLEKDNSDRYIKNLYKDE